LVGDFDFFAIALFGHILHGFSGLKNFLLSLGVALPQLQNFKLWEESGEQQLLT
jgi:hypothetical protein